ncbi:MAG: hypothetical protein IJT16_09620, partial [Lachnospiraceae bacterium]|nr:hypothetical protein [Lachnospiraceae bacterium]
MSGLQNYQEALKNNEPIFRTRTQTGLKSGLTEQPQAPLILRTETFQGTLKTTAQKAEESESPAPVLDHAVYFNRMLENSLDKNLALKVRQDRELKQSGWNDIERIARGSFTQKHPTAKKDRLFGSSENAQIKMAKQTFRNADLCTVRELSALTRYFNTHGLQENPAEGAADQVNDAVLSQYVRSLLDYSLDQRNLTDEYLSENITQVYDYSRRLSRYEALKQAYPKFFASLPETQKISLETRAASSAPLSELLNTHIKLHGIQLTEGKNGKTAVSLWRENADKTTRHREREERQRAYDEKLKAFVRTSFDERNLNIAKRLTESPLLNEADSLVQELEKILAENKDASDLFKLQIDAALQEIKKAGSVRESLLLSQKENLSAYNAGKPEAYGQIKQINRKLVLCAKHIENYKQYLYFLNGNNETVSKSLAQFLIREKHEELLEPVKIRTTLNCLREGAAVNERRALREELKELLEEKKKKAKAAGTLKQKKGRSKTGAEQNPPAKEDIRIAEIKSRLSLKFVPPTVSREEFYESMRVYNKGQEEAAEYKKQKADGNKRKEEIAKRAAKYAADHGLVNPETNTRISPLIMDPGSEWLSDDDLLYFYVATRYEPTEATSEAVRKELYEKGLKPHIDTFLNLKPEDFKSFVPGEDLTFHDRDFWKKRTFVNIGMDMANFLDVLKRNDISLTDDEYVKLRSSGKLMEGIMTDYRTYGNTVIDPLWKVVKKEAKLYEGDVAVDMHNYVFGPDADDEETDEDVRNFLKKYSEEATGYKAECVVEDSENTMEPVAEHADNYVTNIFTELAAGTGNMDYAAAYKRREDNIRAEILQKKDTLAKEKERMKPYFTEVTDEAAEVRLMLKNEDKALALRMTGGNASKWKEGDGDIRAFQRLLKPVEIDANGSVQAAYRENALENGRDSADFLAGGVRRENVIRKFALDAIHIEFTEEMLKPAYIRDHFPEMHEKIGRLESFRKLSKDYGAFLESSAFSEDEKKAIRLKVTDNRFLDTLSAIETYSRLYVGIDGNGKEIERKDLKTDAEKAAWNADRLKQVEAALEGMAGVLSEDIAKQKRMETLYETQGDLINRLNEDYSVIYEKDLDFKRRKAGLEAESKTVDEELEAIRKQIDAEKDKQKLQELYTKQRACFKRKNEISAKYGFTGSSTNDWESVVEPARQLKELAAGLREKEDVSDEARVFAADNGYDLFSEEEIHKARFNLDQKELIKRFGTADGKAVETRLKVLATFEGNRQAFSPEQQNRFNEAFSNTAVQDEDVRSFAWLAKPVKRDIFGKVLKGYEENAAQNTAMLEDYISGDMEKKNRVLKDMAKDILSLDVSPEFFSEKNLTENTEAVISQMMKLFGFSNFYMGHLDFFTSNVFSDEERDELNRRIGGASNFSQLIVSKTQSYLGKLQLDGNGNTVQGFETFQNPASRQASFERLKQSADQYAKLQEELFAEALKEDKAAKETENKYGRQIRQV